VFVCEMMDDLTRCPAFRAVTLIKLRFAQAVNCGAQFRGQRGYLRDPQPAL
jgi:hypothetical protein